MSFSKIKDFIFENYYKGIGFSKGNSYHLIKHLKKRFSNTRQQINMKST